MPTWARVIAAGMGIVLFPIGLIAFFVVRPLELYVLLVASSATGIGIDLLAGAYSGKWPISLQWMSFP